MLIATILTALLITLACILLVRRQYQAQLSLYHEAWQRSRQTIFFQFQTIERLEIEKEMLHEVAVKALTPPDVEDYHEAGGLGFTVNRN